jgi:serine/threonine protein kinase
MSDHRGQHFGNYQLIKLLGEGGYAQVYLGEQVFLKTRVAVKVLHEHLSDEKVEHFCFEADTIAHLEHPHIVRLLDFGVENATPYLIMEYAPKGTLRQRHPQGRPIPLAIVVGYVEQVADALGYAHQQKIIHRDIKPENLLVGRRGEVLLSDFGIAVVAHQTTSLTTQDGLGTISYVAPEQLRGRPRAASDQYALAAVVYEWLTGRMPFRGTPIEVAMQHLEVPPPPMREVGNLFSADVERVVLRAMEKQWQMRYASVREFASALHDASFPRLATVRGPAEDLPFPLPEQIDPPEPAQAAEWSVASNEPAFAGAVTDAIANQKTSNLGKGNEEPAPDDLAGERTTDPYLSLPKRPPGPQRSGRRRLNRRTALLALVALLLVAALGLGSLLLMQGSTPTAAHVAPGLTLSQTQGTQQRATPSPGSSAIPTGKTTPSPISSTPTANPSSSASPTATTAPPNLSVSPGSLSFPVHLLSCLINNQPKTLTLQNTGGGNLSWQASVPNTASLTISPGAGSLSPGGISSVSVQVNCYKLTLSERDTITFLWSGGDVIVSVSISVS